MPVWHCRHYSSILEPPNTLAGDTVGNAIRLYFRRGTGDGRPQWSRSSVVIVEPRSVIQGIPSSAARFSPRGSGTGHQRQ